MAWRIPSSMVMAAISVVLACRAGFFLFLFARALRGKRDPWARGQRERAGRRLSRVRLCLQPPQWLSPANWRALWAAFWENFSPIAHAARRFRNFAAALSSAQPLSFQRRHPDRESRRILLPKPHRRCSSEASIHL